MNFNGPFNAEGTTETDRATEQPAHGKERRGRRGRLIVLGAAVVLAGALTVRRLEPSERSIARARMPRSRSATLSRKFASPA